MPKKIPGTNNRVLNLCRLLNRHNVSYLIVGGVAANLHGTLRSTRDIDLLVPKEIKNMEKLIKALSKLPHGIAKEINPAEIIDKPFTIIGDDPRVDILTIAGKITFKKAARNRIKRKIAGVEVPYLGLEDLIQSKETGRPRTKQIWRFSNQVDSSFQAFNRTHFWRKVRRTQLYGPFSPPRKGFIHEEAMPSLE